MQYTIVYYYKHCIAQLNRFTFNPISHQGFWRRPTCNFAAFPPTAYNLNNINQGPILADSSCSGEITKNTKRHNLHVSPMTVVTMVKIVWHPLFNTTI